MNTKKIEQQARALISGLIPALEAAEPHGEGEERRKSLFIGTVFSVMPSGKYYLPFACSNVEPCPACKGEGQRFVNRRGQARKLRKVKRQKRRLVEHLFKFHGFAFEGRWPERAAARLAALRRRADYLFPVRTCGHCGGVGSREAAMDEAFQEAMDDEAHKHGACIESGEGDPCDMFLSKSVED